MVPRRGQDPQRRQAVSAERLMGKLRPAMADRTVNISAIIKTATSNP